MEKEIFVWNKNKEEIDFEVYKYKNFSVCFLSGKEDLEGCKPFLDVQDKLVTEVLKLDIDYPEEPELSVFIIPEGKIYKKVTGSPYEHGMTGPNTGFSKYNSLAIHQEWAVHKPSWEDFGKVRQIKGQAHEWTHALLGRFYNSHNNVILEGLADLVPLYIMDMQNKMPNYMDRVKRLKRPENYETWENGEIGSYYFLREKGHFQETDEIMKENGLDPRNTQYRQSYMSSYLFMLGAIKKVEKINNLDKVEALNLFLKEFGKTKNWKEEAELLSRLTNTSTEEVCFTTTLQEYGQKHLPKIKPPVNKIKIPRI